MIHYEKIKKQKVSIEFALLSILAIIGFLFFYLWEENAIFEEKTKGMARIMERYAKVIVPDRLSRPGHDASGRQLSIDEIVIKPDEIERQDSLNSQYFVVRKLRRYRLSTPQGEEPVFYIKGLKPDKKSERVEVKVPDGKSIIGLKARIVRNDLSVYLPMSPSLKLLDEDMKELEPFNKPETLTFPRESAVDFEYLFYAKKNHNYFTLMYKEDMKEKSRRININFTDMSYEI